MDCLSHCGREVGRAELPSHPVRAEQPVPPPAGADSQADDGRGVLRPGMARAEAGSAAGGPVRRALVMAVPGAAMEILATVSAWPGVEAHPHRFGGTEYRIGKREIGHIHGDTLVDIPFPTKVRNEVVAAGRADAAPYPARKRLGELLSARTGRCGAGHRAAAAVVRSGDEAESAAMSSRRPAAAAQMRRCCQRPCRKRSVIRSACTPMPITRPHQMPFTPQPK